MSRVKKIWDALRGVEDTPKPAKKAGFPGGTYRNIFSVSYNGEKNLGEIGPIRDYKLDYDALRMRSWQSYLESEIAKTVIDKFSIWIVSKGLKLQCAPERTVLQSEGVNVDLESFNDMVESRFWLWSKSDQSHYSRQMNLNLLAREAFKNCKIGGDVLVVLRYENKRVTVQLIDGAHVCSPYYGTDEYAEMQSNGNLIRNGIELSPKGEHVAYWVKDKMGKYTRIEARSKTTGLKMAFLVYGNTYRIDNHRGLPLIATSMETLKKLERYKEAAVGSAEERQKIVMQIVHNQHSTGENPMAKQLVKAFNVDADEDLPKDVNAVELANNIAATTNKSTYNMPIGSELKAVESRNEMFFKDFYTTNSDIICGAVGIPPNVAFSIYNDSFSASRAATKDWEHTITVNREDFCFQFYQPIYNFWLFTEIMNNKIPAPGYNLFFAAKNTMAIEAYHCARFVGPMFPHIDPLKEVNAERAKLGELAKDIPLTTIEQATEVLNGGDSDSNMEQFSKEIEEAKRLKIMQADVTP